MILSAMARSDSNRDHRAGWTSVTAHRWDKDRSY